MKLKIRAKKNFRWLRDNVYCLRRYEKMTNLQVSIIYCVDNSEFYELCRELRIIIKDLSHS